MTQKWPKTPKINFSEFFEGYIFTFPGLFAHTRGVKEVFFKGSVWSDGTKMDVFGPKMHIFAIFGWF